MRRDFAGPYISKTHYDSDAKFRTRRPILLYERTFYISDDNSIQVKSVLYPGLSSHYQHELAKKQMTGFSGMIAVEIKGGLAGGKAFVEVGASCSYVSQFPAGK